VKGTRYLKNGEAMPSLVITVNKVTEIRVNLPNTATRGVHLNWIGGDTPDEEGYICFHVGGVDGEENISWTTPELSIGDEITIKISEDSVPDSETSRTPYKKMDRR
jgi:hypothetical protein